MNWSDVAEVEEPQSEPEFTPHADTALFSVLLSTQRTFQKQLKQQTLKIHTTNFHDWKKVLKALKLVWHPDAWIFHL